jgi:hypothetical protein
VVFENKVLRRENIWDFGRRGKRRMEIKHTMRQRQEKLLHYLNKHHTMKISVEVMVPTFVSWILVGGDWSASCHKC